MPLAAFKVKVQGQGTTTTTDPHAGGRGSLQTLGEISSGPIGLGGGMQCVRRGLDLPASRIFKF